MATNKVKNSVTIKNRLKTGGLYAYDREDVNYDDTFLAYDSVSTASSLTNKVKNSVTITNKVKS